MKFAPLHEGRFPPLLLGFCLLALLLRSGGAGAESLDPHAFVVRGGEVVLSDGQYFLDAEVDFNLSPAATEALESGVPLTFELQIELTRPRRFWLDEVVVKMTQRYRVRYHALSERYVLTDLTTGDSRTFPTRTSVLNALGTIRGLPLIERRRLNPGQAYQIWLRAGLDVDDLPAPRKTGAYLSPQWRLLSDWHLWEFEA